MLLYNQLVSVAGDGKRSAIVSSQITYKSLLDDIDSRASELCSKIRTGSAVAISSSRPVEFICDFFALNKLGCSVVPINPDVPDDIKHMHVDYYLSGNTIEQYRDRYFQKINDVALILFTSGSTGTPKAVYLSNDNLLSNCLTVGQTCFQFEENVCGLLSAPLHYVLGLNMQMNLMLLNGGAIHIPENPGFDSIIDTLQTGAVNYICGIPLFYRKVIEACVRRSISIRHLKYAFIGGAAWDGALLKDAKKYLGIVPSATYGLSETSPIATFGTMTLNIDYGIYSVGKAIHDVQIKIGQDNEILVKGPNVAIATGHPIPEPIGDWFHTGDCGRIDSQGNLYLIGRIKEIINKGGVKINCSLVEQEIRKLPDVIDCVVGATPSIKYGEDIGVAILGHRNFDVEDFASMHEHRRPKFVLNLDQFPILRSSGKVNRKVIRERLWSAQPNLRG